MIAENAVGLLHELYLLGRAKEQRVLRSVIFITFDQAIVAHHPVPMTAILDLIGRTHRAIGFIPYSVQTTPRQRYTCCARNLEIPRPRLLLPGRRTDQSARQGLTDVPA